MFKAGSCGGVAKGLVKLLRFVPSVEEGVEIGTYGESRGAMRLLGAGYSQLVPYLSQLTHSGFLSSH
jgi:hypothetical protein